jgi:hypothetical protein
MWSLGATLYTAVEGRAPFDKGQPLPTLTEVVTGVHAPFVAAGALATVLDGLLEKDPELRYDAPMARAAFEHVLAEHDAIGGATAQPAEASATRRTDRTAALSLDDVAAGVRQEEQSPITPHPGEPAVPHTYAPPKVLPGDRGGARRSRTPLVLGTLALLLVVGIVLLFSSPFGRSSLNPGAASGSGTPSTAAAPVPAGWVTHHTSDWTVAVPPSYTPGSFNGAPQYKDRATGRTLRVSTTSAGTGSSDVVADRRFQAAAFASKHPSYREIGIGKADYRGRETADWEFTYSDGGADLHALSRVFVVNGRGYSLFFQTHGTDDWAAARADFDRIAAAFQP